MPRTGRPKQPDALRLLSGSHPERAHGDAPTSPPVVEDPPDWLDDLGKEAWSRLVDRVGEMRLLTRADYDLLIVYSVAYSDFRAMAAKIGEDGLTAYGGSGGLKPHPLIAAKQNAMRQMLTVMSQVGMTPSARASLHVEPPGEKDALMDHLNGRTSSQKPRATDGPKRRR